jgi:hypothetical protein
MLAPPRPGRLSGPYGDNLIAKDHRDSLVPILHLGHGALRVGRKSVNSILSSSSLVLNPRRSSKMWIEPLACLAFVALLIPHPQFPSLLWRVDQRKVNPVPLPIFWFCYA